MFIQCLLKVYFIKRESLFTEHLYKKLYLNKENTNLVKLPYNLKVFLALICVDYKVDKINFMKIKGTC
jgi:hypothetical protein